MTSSERIKFDECVKSIENIKLKNGKSKYTVETGFGGEIENITYIDDEGEEITISDDLYFCPADIEDYCAIIQSILEGEYED